MHIETVHIHNFRSVIDATFDLSDYALLVGANNAGKSNVIDALRAFYEDHRYKAANDFPRIPTDDDESWMDVEFALSEEEWASLADEYKWSERCILKVRKFFKKTDTHKDGIYGYIGPDEISESYFYGARNVQQGKFGRVIYIPAVSQVTDVTKLTGPSALRELMYDLMGNLAQSSAAYAQLDESFERFATTIKQEQTDDARSISALEADINAELEEWGMRFSLDISPIDPQNLVKNLISPQLIDGAHGSMLDVDQFGHGLQRHLIFTLIQLQAKYKGASPTRARKEFHPDFTLLLFEEPEAFLHPSQQTTLYNSLKALSKDGSQVVVTTHSPYFVSHRTSGIPSIIHLDRYDGVTDINQIKKRDLKPLFTENREINDILETSSFEDVQPDNYDEDQMMEPLRYFLALDPERCGMFFARRVLIVEGATEKYFLNYLIRNEHLTVPRGGIYVLNALGKFNIHRFMNLLGAMGIMHMVLYDLDGSYGFQQRVNELIQRSGNVYTRRLYGFDTDLEDFLGVEKPTKGKDKSERLMFQLLKKQIPQDRLNRFVHDMNDLINA
jgi:predicted ATP-dependent endonuclease of OLD family